jgi:hypothetical protein
MVILRATSNLGGQKEDKGMMCSITQKKIRNRSGHALVDLCKDLCMSETCGKETEKWQIEDELLLRVQ